MAKKIKSVKKINKPSGIKKYALSIAVIAVFLLSIPLTVSLAQPHKNSQVLAGTSAAVSIVDFEFSPATITIPVGTTVTWTNMSVSDSDHTTSSDVVGTANSWDSGLTNPLASSGLKDTFSFTFANAGTFTYHCNVHTFMHGTVIVTAAAAAAPTVAPTAIPVPSAITPTLVCEGGNGTPPCATIPPTDALPSSTETEPTVALPTLSPSGDGGSSNLLTILLDLIAIILKFLQSLVH